ncbi:MAG: threonine ammonia-lyase [Candidatus Thermoplasmatota archaeon]|nr:threonine ammonia-lyase [Candidatus Thermoplasmatota archaeon]
MKNDYKRFIDSFKSIVIGTDRPMISFSDIKEAYEVVNTVVKQTAVKKSKTFSEMTSSNLFLKMENLQLTGSFKIRGAYNKIYHLSKKEKDNGVVCSSAGNHAQGVALASSMLDVKSTVFMPIFAPPTKINATKSYGATVFLKGKTYDEAYQAAKEFEQKNQATFVHAFNDNLVIAGQGTIGIELIEQVKDIDVILVPIGGGGLISGISVAVKKLNPKTKIIGVQAKGAQAMIKSMNAKRVVSMKDMSTIADGIAVKTPGEITLQIIKDHVDKIVTVTDAEIAQTMYHLLQRAKLIVEPAGAASLAAMLHDKVRYSGKNVVCVLSGGNVNLSLLDQVIEQGMMHDHLMARMSIIAPDKSKILKDIIAVLSSINANVQSIDLDRSTTSVPVGSVNILLTFQTLGLDQIMFIKDEIEKKGFHCELSS